MQKFLKLIVLLPTRKRWLCLPVSPHYLNVIPQALQEIQENIRKSLALEEDFKRKLIEGEEKTKTLEQKW